MPELTAFDLEEFTGGRLPDDDDTQALLNAELAAVRRYCGWSVSPVMTEVVVMDGLGGCSLSLPTMYLLSVDSIVDDGETLTAADLRFSRLGFVEKRSGAAWSRGLGSITATFTHGFTEDEAADWRRAVLSSADLADRSASGGSSGGFTAIGPFQYGSTFAAHSQFGDAERAVFDGYRIMLAP